VQSCDLDYALQSEPKIEPIFVKSFLLPLSVVFRNFAISSSFASRNRPNRDQPSYCIAIQSSSYTAIPQMPLNLSPTLFFPLKTLFLSYTTFFLFSSSFKIGSTSVEGGESVTGASRLAVSGENEEGGSCGAKELE